MMSSHIRAVSSLALQEITLLVHKQIVKYCRVAPAALWTLDYFITFDNEVQILTSKHPWSITHGLFVVTRYFPLIGFICAIYDALTPQLPLGKCYAIYKLTGSVLLVGMIATEGLLLLRTLALWHSNKLAKLFLGIVYGLAVIGMIVCLTITVTFNLNSICSPSTTASSLRAAVQIEQITTGMFASAACFELTVMGMTLLHWFRVKAGNGNRIVSALTHGNFLYSSSLFVTSIGNIIFFVLPIQDGWSGLLDVFQGVLHGVLASRILFSLREVDRKIDFESVQASGMHFASAVPMSEISA